MNFKNKKKEVRTILMRDWDPIGIKEEEYAQDEYDMYIPQIINMIANNCQPEDLLNFLEFVIIDRMGLELNKEMNENNLRTVRNLLKLKNQIQ